MHHEQDHENTEMVDEQDQVGIGGELLYPKPNQDNHKGTSILVRKLPRLPLKFEEGQKQYFDHNINCLSCLTSLFTKVEQIVAVFNASTRQKAWDHFSKAQRKNIDIWRKHSEELRNAHSEQLMGIRREEEMEMSDDDSTDNPSNKKLRVDESGKAANLTFMHLQFLTMPKESVQIVDDYLSELFLLM
ncbi:hypothetical protein lerEdw1_013217 [Lerista edwardsae]|nr:hypothetical protein lerEdw1_013217 [Lerista edwardsae]